MLHLNNTFWLGRWNDAESRVHLRIRFKEEPSWSLFCTRLLGT